MALSHLRTDLEDASLIEILERILDKGIVLEAWAHVVLDVTDFQALDNRIVVAPERRNKPFIVPTRKLKS